MNCCVILILAWGIMAFMNGSTGLGAFCLFLAWICWDKNGN